MPEVGREGYLRVALPLLLCEGQVVCEVSIPRGVVNLGAAHVRSRAFLWHQRVLIPRGVSAYRTTWTARIGITTLTSPNPPKGLVAAALASTDTAGAAAGGSQFPEGSRRGARKSISRTEKIITGDQSPGVSVRRTLLVRVVVAESFCLNPPGGLCASHSRRRLTRLGRARSRDLNPPRGLCASHSTTCLSLQRKGFVPRLRGWEMLRDSDSEFELDLDPA